MHLAWEYASNPADHGCFSHMLHVSPHVFQTILSLIQHHPVFTSHSNVPQAPVEMQLAVTLYHMGQYGNSASVQDIAWTTGCSEGFVESYTDHCFDAIESLQEIFICRLTPEEKEWEKQWIDQKLGLKSAWRDGWLMYDGTIVVLYQCPGLNGDAHYTHKANYGLNVQVCSTTWFSNFTFIFYSPDRKCSLNPSCHDACAFEGTAAHRFPDWLFEGNEFAWADLAYPCTAQMIPVHKEPASQIPRNAIFDYYVSSLHV
jgi:DDE superfamily endonuclease